MHSTADYVRLHFLVFLFGFTGILGKLVSISALDMVLYRTLLAAIGIGITLISAQGTFRISKGDLARLVFTGFIVAIHWLTFFLSARISNVSVSLVGFATASLWTALLEPLVKGYTIRTIEVIFGLIVMAGLYIIFSSDFSYSSGLMLGVFSGLTCAIFTIINSMMVKRIGSNTITFYEMTGAFLLTATFIPLYQYNTGGGPFLPALPNGMDWIYILLLGGLCTVYAYSSAVELMKRVSVFFFQLTLNLEPVYGIIMAVVVFGEAEKMNVNFYAGTLVILCAVLLYPWMKRRFTANPTSAGHP